MKICLVGLNNKRVGQIATLLAQKLGFKFIDLAKEFDYFLLNSLNYPTIKAEKSLAVAETKLILAALKEENVVVYLPNDMFLSNQNYKKIDGTKIVITEVFDDEIKTNLQNLISKNCNYSFLDKADIINKILKTII